MKSWVKLYTEINHDPDVGILSWAQRGILSAVFALAGEIDDRDENDQETGILDTVARTTWRLRCGESDIRDLMRDWGNGEKLIERDGMLIIVAYGNRQRRKPSDSKEAVAARVKRHRASSASDAPDGREVCNADVTPVNRPVSRPESESESESESEKTLGADDAAPTERRRSAKDETRLALEVHFAETTDLPRPKTGTEKQRRSAGTLWWAPLRDIAELCEWDRAQAMRLIDATVAHLDGKCTIASPKSILATAQAICTGNVPGARLPRGPTKRKVCVVDPDTGTVEEREVTA